MASPAAAAQVSRALKQAGIRKAVELRKGVESSGYAVELRPDHVHVEYVSFVDSDAEREEGLSRCLRALEGKYDVTMVTGTIAVPGEWREAPVLEVTSDRWRRESYERPRSYGEWQTLASG